VFSLDNIKHIYFLGIGGIGMSALARYFKAQGKEVSGYDKTPTVLTDELAGEGIHIHFEDNIELVKKEIRHPGSEEEKNKILIVVTPAVPRDHSEFVFFTQMGFNIKKRAEVLGIITQNTHTIAVAGTHGKTTTSSLTAHILRSSGMDITAFLGGITKNYRTNLLLSKRAGKSNDEVVVVEADEYDRSFLTLHPQMAVITSMDPDHLDIYGSKEYVEESYSLFSKQVKRKLIIKKSIEGALKYGDVPALTYSLTEKADYTAQNIGIKDGQFVYDIHTPRGVINKVTLGLPGMHNVENSVAATAVAIEMGVGEEAVRIALASFKGVNRRFDYQVKTKDLVYIDDYAHHPEELKACISSVRQLYPGKKITGVFQPHLYTRTRDFADDFAKSLGLLDELILLQIYPARELPIEGVSSSILLDKVKLETKVLAEKAGLLDELSKRDLQVLITMGAGDIDMLVQPIRQMLEQRLSLKQ
jgi:UDP-N-acetylmuramate--alanine ligase